jgi:RNA polymerase sigma-70 factor (ECF subfamily)
LKSDVHRLKQRYRELLRAEIADTVSSPAEINDEVQHLIATIGGN